MHRAHRAAQPLPQPQTAPAWAPAPGPPCQALPAVAAAWSPLHLARAAQPPVAAPAAAMDAARGPLRRAHSAGPDRVAAVGAGAAVGAAGAGAQGLACQDLGQRGEAAPPLRQARRRAEPWAAGGE